MPNEDKNSKASEDKKSAPLCAQMDTTKEGIKSYLDSIGEKTNQEWHSQAAHKIAVLAFILDCAKIEDKETRNAIKKQFLATPSSFGCNASAMAQALGRPSAKEKLEKTFDL